ncbi:MAG: hypothetical protein S0880_14795 [Actinomycetota bacterium]|nr:hypothetical protein [Actinomycetota bacterium]
MSTESSPSSLVGDLGEPAPAGGAPPAPAGVPRSRVDLAVCRFLCIPTDGPATTESEAQQAFSRSILISAVRCLLTYIFLPFIAPALGIAANVGPGLGLVIGAAALTSNVISIRRFWRANHRYRWHFTAISVSVMVLVTVLVVEDVIDLLA